MVTTDIRVLLEKLNPVCTRALEAAVGSCVSRGHFELRWEHLLSALLDIPESEAVALFGRAGIESAAVRRALEAELKTLPRGNTGKPSFSPVLLDIVEAAWGISTLRLGREAVCSAALLWAALDRGMHATGSWAELMRPLESGRLQREAAALAAGAEEGPRLEPPVNQTGTAPLERFCTDLTARARAGRIDPVLGRDSEIRQVLDILGRRRKNNPILVGEAGVGKTAVVEGLALRIAAGEVPSGLRGVELWELDLGLLQAGASVKGEFEKRLKGVLDAARSGEHPRVLFIDEAHTLIGAGGPAGGGDAANLLKPALARGELRAIAATTWAEYRRYVEKDPALSRRFQLVKVDEPGEERCAHMLRGLVPRLESHHGVRITDAAVRAAVALSHRYVAGRQLPDKAVDVLDTACGRVRLSQTAKPAALEGIERALASARMELDALERDHRAGVAPAADRIVRCRQSIATLSREAVELSSRWETEKTCVAQISSLEARLAAGGSDSAAARTQLEDKARELARLQGETPLVFAHVGPEVCGQVVSDWTGVPAGAMLRSEAEMLLALESRLTPRVLGQPEAIAAVAEAVRGGKTGLRNPEAPLAVLLFAGPSGVGKTECAHALAEAVFGDESFMTVINMSEYQELHTVSQLKGSPPGYVGYGEGGVLTEAVRQRPYSLVLLDEIEKAHREVLNLFYQVFDKGVMRDAEGRQIDFRNTLIVMTSNLGTEAVETACAGGSRPGYDELCAAVREELASSLPAAFLGRCRIVPFYPLDTAAMRSVVTLKLGRLAARAQSVHGVTLVYGDNLAGLLTARCTVAASGARDIDTVIERILVPALARELLLSAPDTAQGRRLRVSMSPEGVVTAEWDPCS